MWKFANFPRFSDYLVYLGFYETHYYALFERNLVGTWNITLHQYWNSNFIVFFQSASLRRRNRRTAAPAPAAQHRRGGSCNVLVETESERCSATSLPTLTRQCWAKCCATRCSTAASQSGAEPARYRSRAAPRRRTVRLRPAE